jgi:hypothetical protein
MTIHPTLAEMFAALDVAKSRYRQGETKKPKVETGDGIRLRRLPVTGMTLAAQAVTGQPSGRTNISKGDNQMTNSDLVSIAKSAVETGRTELSKAEFYKAIKSRAEDGRKAGETFE